MNTLKDLVALSEKGLEDNEIVRALVTADVVSSEKAFMNKADDYYDNKNDINNLDFRSYVVNGITKINENRSNCRISHNFFALLVDQAANYVAGNPIGYKADDESFQKYLEDYFMFDFDDTNIDWLTDARKKGKSYLHVYYDTEGELNYTVIPAQQIIPIYTDTFSKKLSSVIRYYSINGVDEKGQSVQRQKAEWWSDTEVRIFISDSKGQFGFYDSMPHWTTSIDTTPDYIEPHSWGKVPFIQLFSNSNSTSDLQSVKGFIDAYDLVDSEFINQIADVRELLIKVLGYGDASANEIMRIFRSTGIVKLDDTEGDVDTIKSEIPVEARQAALKNLKDNIFMIGKAVDPNPEKLGTAVSGIALKMLYGPLDLKCSSIIRKMYKALYEFIWFITDDYNRMHNTSINYKDIKFTFNKNMIINDAEIVESLVKSKGVISDETIISKHPYVDNPSDELELMKEQEEKEMDEFNRQIQTSPVPGGDK